MDRREFLAFSLLSGCGGGEMEYEIQSSPVLRTAHEIFPGGQRGTWTPRLAFQGQTTSVGFVSQAGDYLKIGDVVSLWFFLEVSSLGGGGITPLATIEDLPFPARSRLQPSGGVVSRAAFNIGDWHGMASTASSICSMSGYIVDGESSAIIQGGLFSAVSTTVWLSRSYFTNSTFMAGFINYLAAP